MSIVRRLATTLAGATLAVSLAAPAAHAQLGDFTNGGRLISGSSELSAEPPVQLGSLGGPELTQVDQVDVDQYVGKWYQVAAIPQPFNLQCVRDVTAEYAVLDDNTISVSNRCITPWGAPSGIEGQATVVDADTKASLRVSFPGVPFQDPNGSANYRITYLAEDYSLAIVGDPARRSGFVLSRTTSLSQERWQEVTEVIEQRGWWPCVFLTTPQTGGRSDTVPLCQR